MPRYSPPPIWTIVFCCALIGVPTAFAQAPPGRPNVLLIMADDLNNDLGTGDQGLINEPEMIQRMWPGGVQPETAQPYIALRGETAAPSRQPSMKIVWPAEIVIYVPTQGASLGYTTEDGPAAKWRLYTGPILVDGPVTIRAKAIRYGYKESAETRVTLTKF